MEWILLTGVSLAVQGCDFGCKKIRSRLTRAFLDGIDTGDVCEYRFA